MKSNYTFEKGKFVIRNFGDLPPFTSFLPGIAGLKGRPLWAFYISRGQGIAGFGVEGKDFPIMEFSPAEIAYSNAPRQGFRTFLRIGGRGFEPFRVDSGAPTRMEIGRSGFAIEEEGSVYRLRAEYFGVPNRDYAALGRIVSYTNTTEKEQEVELLDGLAHILPYGLSNSAFKETGNLFKSWMTAEGTEEGYAFVRMRSSTADCASVSAVTGGNFFVSAGDCDIVVDPKPVFGEDRTKTSAKPYFRRGITSAILKEQCLENVFFCAFAHKKVRVKAGETVCLCELIGYAETRERVASLKKTLTSEEVLSMKREAEEEAEKISSKVETHTAFPLFDEYISQSYFDNVLRGGMPVLVGGRPYYVFSRKHGDPERDYNCFKIEPKPYSCGDGNFRDVVQNRRNDIFITPECGDFNIRYFFSLVQTDGYNPLSVLGVRYTCPQVPEKYLAHSDFLKGEFTVGDAAARLNIEGEELDELIRGATPVYSARFSEGYWTDHFVYLIDLVTSYLSVYPERGEELLYKTPIGWFRSGVRVLPRSRRAVRTESGVVRLHSLERAGEDGWEEAGGKPFETSLAAKLLFLALIKTATLDPLGCGIDMEGGRPGWCDATNGLPALFGSNVADSLELYRLLGILQTLLKGGRVVWAKEQDDLFRAVLSLLARAPSPQAYYDSCAEYRETYLRRVYGGLEGTTAKEGPKEIAVFLKMARARLKEGFKRAKELGGGRIPTYLTFEPEETEELGGGYVLPKSFKARALPHFLEGFAKSVSAGDRKSYPAARRSPLYDKKLGLFKTSEPLDGESLVIGRIRSFPAGWLERESCFLHMSYKMLLALLQAGMYEEFYREISTGLIPFMSPERYGRSTLENSSFLVTSNHSDRGKWGKGYQARLTGANAEALSMWRLMMGLEQPFTVEGGELKFSLSPKLHKDFFADGRVVFTLFGRTKVTYLNRSGKSTWEVRVSRYRLIGEETAETLSVCGELAEKVRAGKYREIEVELI